jgi:hypothetical protein
MRDGGQCTFRDRHGRRCSAREHLEFHHIIPFAQGGDHSENTIRLVCKRSDSTAARGIGAMSLVSAANAGTRKHRPTLKR